MAPPLRDCHHIALSFLLPHSNHVIKKSIAAALLLATMAWAEISMAPMLLMHNGHFHSSHLVAQSMPAHHDHMVPGHSCCPQISPNETADRLNFRAETLPCQDEHRCCFLQGPQNVPAPVT